MCFLRSHVSIRVCAGPFESFNVILKFKVDQSRGFKGNVGEMRHGPYRSRALLKYCGLTCPLLVTRNKTSQFCSCFLWQFHFRTGMWSLPLKMYNSRGDMAFQPNTSVFYGINSFHFGSLYFLCNSLFFFLFSELLYVNVNCTTFLTLKTFTKRELLDF